MKRSTMKSGLGVVAALALSVGLVSGARAQADDSPVLKLYKVRYRFAAELEPHVRAALTAEGRLSVDQGTNSLVIVDRPSNLALIEQILAHLDARPRMVRIEARFVSEEDLARQAIAVRWAVSAPGLRVGTAPLLGSALTGAAVSAAAGAQRASGREAKTVTLLLESGKEGFIQAGADSPIAVTGPMGGTTVAYARTGTGFTVRPTVLDGKHVKVAITPETSRPSAAALGAIERAGAATEVVVGSDEQVVIGSVGTDAAESSTAGFLDARSDKSLRRLVLLLTARVVEEESP